MRENSRSFSGNSSRTLRRTLRKAARPGRRFAGGDQAATQGPTARLDERAHATDQHHVAVDLPQRNPDEPALRKGAETAAGGDFGRNRLGRLAQGRRWRRGGSALGGEGGPDDLSDLLGVRNRQAAHDDGVGLARSALGAGKG